MGCLPLPVSSKSSGLISEFYVELERLFTEAAISVVPTIIARDFNVHFNNEAKSEPLSNLLESFNLTQHILSPTHHSGHILDMVDSSSDNNLISSVTVIPGYVSDHYRIEITVSILARPFVVAMTAKRNFRNTDNVAFRSELEYVCVDMTTCGKYQQVEELVATYNNNLTMCLDKHAPWRRVPTRNNIPHPWYDADIADARDRGNPWRRTKLEVHRQLYVNSRDEFSALIMERKIGYFQEPLEYAYNMSMFRILRSLEVHQMQLPEFNSKKESYFQEQIENLLNSLHCQTAVDHSVDETPRFSDSLEVFEPTNTAEIASILANTDKTCTLDSLPTKQLNDKIDSVVPIVTCITNASLVNAVMPGLLKQAIVRPLLKKPSLDKDTLNIYRPVSNLSHLSKINDKVLARRIICHISDQRMQDCFQSAYRKNHSTETALLCVTNAMKVAMDNRQRTTLVLIDFCPAFDTINHKILIKRLRLRYDIVDKALGWLQSYLQNRTRRVVIHDASSNTTCLTSGVLQGSVFGSLLFSLYVQPIGDMLRAHGLLFNHYADDLQLYCHFDLTATALATTLRRMEHCLEVVKQWMTSNCLCINDNKTEYLPVVPRTAAALVDSTVIHDVTIIVSQLLRHDLLVTLVSSWMDDLKKQVSSIVSVCSFHFRRINQMSRYLPMTTKERVVNAIITSRLDCTSLLYGTCLNNIARPQRMHKSAARLILRRPRSDSATPLLCIRSILVFTYRAVHGDAPKYLCDLVCPYTPTRVLRSANNNMLTVQRTHVWSWRREYLQS